MDLQLDGMVALVTGSSRGVGREIALSLAREGVGVGVCGRDEQKLAEVDADIRALGAKCCPVVADFWESGECQRVVNEVAKSFGSLNILVNNASTVVDGLGRFEESGSERLMERLEGKARWAIECTQAAIPHLRSAGGGRIILIGGAAARAVTVAPSEPTSTPVVAGMGNAAMARLGKHLSAELSGDRILVNTVHPGAVKTDRFEARVRRLAEEQHISVEEAAAAMDASIPLGRLVEPSDIASLVLFLASPLSAMITGQTVAIDGGASPVVVY